MSASEAASELIWRLSTYVNMGGMSWDQVTYLNQATKEYSDLVAGRKYYAVACGVDDGTLISNVAVQEYTVPMPEITDNCTFTVDFTRMAPTEVDFTVTPTNAATRYLAVIDEAAEPATDGYLHLYFRHNAYDDAPVQGGPGIVSFKLDTVRDLLEHAQGICIHATTIYNGEQTYTINKASK